MLQEVLSFELPPAQWSPPLSLPDFSQANDLAIDLEVNDPDLTSKGPSHLRRLGHVAGVALSDGKKSVYLPVGHLSGNLDSQIIFSWLSDVLRKERTWVVANGQYDLGWLKASGLPEPNGKLFDVQIADTLIDEENPNGYSLDAIAKRHLGAGKDETILRKAAAAYGIDPKSDMWKLPPAYVGEYAETDALRTYQLKTVLLPKLEKQNLLRPMELEMKVMPCLLAATMQGLRIDTAYAEELNDRWQKRENELLRSLQIRPEDLWNKEHLLRICREENIPIPTTAKGNESLGKDYLASLNHPKINPILELRAIQRTRSIYLEQNLIHNSINGRVHPQYIQMASDEGGTRTSRLACKNPNAQQFPKRSRLFDAKAIRKCLIAEEGCIWGKLDYWSQEPVIQNHYALKAGLPEAEKIRDAFLRGEKLYDYVAKATGNKCNYDQCKEVVLGRSYGMGKDKMAARMGLSINECDEVLTAFDRTVPYVKELALRASYEAGSKGFVKTILGYRRHFDLWQPSQSKEPPLPFNEARERWPKEKLERAGTHKAFNAKIQGSAANQSKLAIVLSSQAGIRTNLYVHDEINSASLENEKQARQLKQIMEECLPLLSPGRADLDLGSSWQ